MKGKEGRKGRKKERKRERKKVNVYSRGISRDPLSSVVVAQ